VALTIWSRGRRFPVGLHAAILARAMLCIGRQVCLLAAAADGSWIRGEGVSPDRVRGQWRIVVSASPRVLPRVMSGPDQAFDGVLTSVAMFLRNLLILAITAALPLLGMGAVTAYWINRDRKKAEKFEGEVSLSLASPISLSKVLKFGLLFLTVQVISDLGQRLVGNAGFQIVSVLGGFVSSASTTTAASANMAVHGKVSSTQAGMAAVFTSMASALVNLPIVQREVRTRAVTRGLAVSSIVQIVVGIAILVLESRFVRFF
jgi:Domain of unknown function (DUF4010)